MTGTIGNNIGDLRQGRSLTQEELAQEVSVSRQTIIAIEKGSYTPSLLLAMRLAHFLKKSVEEIFWIEK